MAILQPTEFTSRCLAMTMSALLTGGATAEIDGERSPIAQKEIERREAAVQEGQMLLLKGDEAYKAGKYKEASEAFAGARDSFPDAPATTELRAAATQRYAQASVEYGRELSRKGDVEGAKAVVDKALTAAPDDFATKTYRTQLDDPIRTNPSLTKEHAADVDEVRRLLYTAQGAFDLGKFDEANKLYKDIIRIDPYNAAARRGMEQIAAQKSNYAWAASDHTRAELLAEVDGAWELPLASDLVMPQLPDVSRIDAYQTDFIPLSTKISRIVVPRFRLEQATLMEAIDLLRLRASENDTFETDQAKKGLNIAVNLGDPKVSPGKDILAKTFDLNVRNVPVGTLLKYITDITRTSFKVDDFAVTITPVGMYADELISRTYRVPPDFLSNLTAGATAEAQPVDIFNTDIGKGGLLAERKGVQQAFAEQGVSFPDGASAILNPTSNTLRVTNTVGNQDIIEQIIDSIAQTEPVSVAVRVTMIKIQQKRLEELGFDWLLDNFSFGVNNLIPGASNMNLSGGTTGNGTAITDILPVPGAVLPTNPITAGNRSGDGAISGDTISSLIAAGSTGGRQVNNRAPGILGVNGTVGGATIQVLMRGLNQKTGVDLMAQPSVTTRSGQAASIVLIDEFIYPTEYEPPELPARGGGVGIGPGGLPVGLAAPPSIVTPAFPKSFEKRDLGISLEVLPVADANKRYVDVTLNPVVSDFEGFVNYGSPINSTTTGLLGPVTTELTPNEILMPVFNVQRVNSNLVVADGATIVIGGLMKDEITTVNDKTPILGDIPVVGRLFQSDAKEHISTAILFLVNVELLDPTGRPYRDR